jgi:hypothetical protein
MVVRDMSTNAALYHKPVGFIEMMRDKFGRFDSWRARLGEAAKDFAAKAHEVLWRFPAEIRRSVQWSRL